MRCETPDNKDMPRTVAVTDWLSVASQIVEADIADYAEQGYRTVINNRPDDEEPGQLSSTLAAQRAQSLGLDYHYLPVTAATLTQSQLDAFAELLATAEKPVVAHCRSGTRCYLLWAATQVRQGASADALIGQAANQGFDISALKRLEITATNETENQEK